MGKTSEEIINRHVLNIATDAPYTFKWRDNLGKSTIDLTLTRGIKNLKVKTKEIETIKAEHQAIEINIEGKDETIMSNPKFKTCELGRMKRIPNTTPKRVPNRDNRSRDRQSNKKTLHVHFWRLQNIRKTKTTSHQ